MLCVEVSAMLLVILNRGVGCMFKRSLLSALCVQKDIQDWWILESSPVIGPSPELKIEVLNTAASGAMFVFRHCLIF